MSQDALRNQYSDESGRCERLLQSTLAQIGQLLTSNEITLGVPIEGRVKTWTSIDEKIQRKELTLNDVKDLDDLVGIRVILLFRSDLDAVISLIESHFKIVSSEDTGKRLGDSRFGYQSQHIIVKIPDKWLGVPSFSSLGDLKIELQIRTLAQHIWAAASHKLQYKNEDSVPPPIRRTINRASAILEIVNLEFERVLAERRTYVASSPESSDPDAPLNVDSLALVLSEELPAANRSGDESYAELLENLNALSVTTASGLRKILKKHKGKALKKDAELVADRRSDPEQAKINAERLSKGVAYNHVGLSRRALREEFGSEVVSRVMQETNSIFRQRRKQERT